MASSSTRLGLAHQGDRESYEDEQGAPICNGARVALCHRVVQGDTHLTKRRTRSIEAAPKTLARTTPDLPISL